MIPAQSTIPWLNKFLNNASSQSLSAFVVPGMEIARAFQLELENCGLTITDTPRHANVLLLIGEIPENLRIQALTLYRQMPNPKAILAIGTKEFDPLPPPDIEADFYNLRINHSVSQLRKIFAENAFEKNGIYTEETKQKIHHEDMTQNMEGMNHEESDMGFMSMVSMTENLPKSPDGLPMEWSEVHFGPLFAGLPGGLELTFLMDGDSISQAEVSVESVKRNLEKKWLGNIKNFIKISTMIDPLAPQFYCILAEQALEHAYKKTVDDKTKNIRLLFLEKERVINNLNWLTSFTSLLHFSFLTDDAKMHLKNVQNAQTTDEYIMIQNDVSHFLSRIENNWLLKKRLSGIGILKDKDTWMRFIIKLLEIDRSLLVLKKHSIHNLDKNRNFRFYENNKIDSDGQSLLKTPKGNASLSITLKNGNVSAVSMISPSAKKIADIPQLVQNSEVGDALIAIASLDISPWEAAL